MMTMDEVDEKGFFDECCPDLALFLLRGFLSLTGFFLVP
jgi:hypothetical protein